MKAIPCSITFPLESYFSSPILLLFLPIILLYVLKYKSSHSSSSKLPLPPGPRPWPLIGNLLQMGTKPHAALANLSKTYGPLMSLRLGTQLVVVGSSPEAAIEMLKTKDHLLSGRCVPHVSFAKDPEMNKDSIAWTFECTERWRFFRTLMRNELFSSKMVDEQAEIREKKAHQMVEFFTEKLGQKVLIREVVFAYVFNVLSNIYVSRDLTDFEGEKSQRVSRLIREMMELYVAPNVSDLFPVLGRLDLQGLRKSTDACVKRIRDMWEPIIRERREGLNGDCLSQRRDFLDALIEYGRNDEQISFTFVEMLAAVSDATSSTIEWALSELIKSPHSMSRLREELSKELTNQDQEDIFLVKESKVAHLPYLHACIKEVLRLHPPAPLLSHKAIQHTHVLNYTIPKDAQIFVNVWAIARDPTLWADPLCFRPERFLESDKDYKGNNFEYLPFGSGRRICAGLPMAIRKVQLGLACLVHYFDWSLPDGGVPSELDMSERYGLTLMKEEPLVLIAKRRN